MNETDRPVTLITGAAKGIGYAAADAAHRGGHHLVLLGRSDSVAALAQQFPPGAASHVIGDVTDPTATAHAVDVAQRTYGRLDAVIANAGIAVGPSLCGELEGPDPSDQWRTMILTNVLGTALTVRASARALIETRGRLVLIGSVLGRYTMPGSLYSATKHAIAGIAEATRLELRGTGVSVTLIEPGPVNTSFGGSATPDSTPTTPALTPDDVAAAVMYALTQPAGVDINELLLRPHGATP